MGYHQLSDFVVHTDSETIFSLEGLSKAGDHIFVLARGGMEYFLMPLFLDKKIQLQPSGLKGDDVSILGASSLVLKWISRLD